MKGIIWNEQYKIRLAQCIPELNKHDVIKILLVRKLRYNHRHESSYINIYTEFEATDGVICDVYMENTKTKEVFAFEIQKDFSKKWLDEKCKQYKDFDVYGFKTAEFIPINLNKFPDNINEIYDELDGYVV